MHVAIRVDASPVIGIGHLHRCLALAEALASTGMTPCFVTRALGVDVRRIVKARGNYSVYELPALASQVEAQSGKGIHTGGASEFPAVDAAETISRLIGIDYEWVVVDHYAFDAAWHRMVADALGCRIAVIDDLADRHIAAELLIDHNLVEDHRAKYRAYLPSNASILGGPRFALLGRAYAAAPRWQPSERVESIGIFLGGSDAGNATLAAWRACREVVRFRGEIELVLTSANPHRETLRLLRTRDQALSISEDLADLSAFFARHDLQIGAGGGATWERCCIGAPTLALQLADNQSAVVPALARYGAVATIEENEVPSELSIGRALNQLLSSPGRRLGLSERARTLVDGHGAHRVALWMSKRALCVRPASMADARRLHSWRNDPVIRAVSSSDAPIDFSEHVAWMERTIADPSRCLLLGIVGDQCVGAIRFDHDVRAQTVRVSLYLDPLLHGLGLGSNLLRAGQDYWARHRRGGRTFVATVLQRNEPSRRLFASAGYRFKEGYWVRPIHLVSKELRA